MQLAHATRAALCDNYPPLAAMATATKMQVPCRRLDDVLTESNIDEVAAIKLDTQGSELLILQGAVEALRTCALVDIEVQFNPLYVGAGLFCDVDRFLRDNGFVLWRLEQLVHYAPEQIPAAMSDIVLAADPAPQQHVTVTNGQVFWGQAQYVRAEYPRTNTSPLQRENGVRAALVAGAYGYWDLALEIIEKVGDMCLHDELHVALDALPHR